MNKISQKQSQHLLSRAKESSGESSVRLTKLELLTFNGDILKFETCPRPQYMKTKRCQMWKNCPTFVHTYLEQLWNVSQV